MKGTVLNDQQFNSVLSNLYDCVLEPGLLLNSLKDIDRLLESDLCHLVGWTSGTNNTLLSLMTNSAMDSVQSVYANYFCTIDPRRQKAQRKEVGEVFVCSDYFDTNFVSKNEFYNDFLFSFNARYIIGTCLLRDDQHEICIVFNHNLGRDTFSPEQRLNVQRLIPHLQNTIRLILKAAPLRASIFAGEDGLNAFDQGLLVLDTNGFVNFANKSAQALLNKNSCIVSLNKKVVALWGQHKSLEELLYRVKTTRQPESITLHSFNAKTSEHEKYYLTVLAQPKDGYQAAVGKDGQGILGDIQTGANPLNSISFNVLPNADLLLIISKSQRQNGVSGSP